MLTCDNTGNIVVSSRDNNKADRSPAKKNRSASSTNAPKVARVA